MLPMLRWMSKDGADLSPGAAAGMTFGLVRAVWALRWPLGILALIVYLIG